MDIWVRRPCGMIWPFDKLRVIQLITSSGTAPDVLHMNKSGPWACRRAALQASQDPMRPKFINVLYWYKIPDLFFWDAFFRFTIQVSIVDKAFRKAYLLVCVDEFFKDIRIDTKVLVAVAVGEGNFKQ